MPMIVPETLAIMVEYVRMVLLPTLVPALKDSMEATAKQVFPIIVFMPKEACNWKNQSTKVVFFRY